jgi:kynurenine formamidase
MTNGDPSAKIDEIPLEWFLGRGVKLDFRRFPDGYVVTAADVDEELDRIGHTLEPFDIVLVNTSAGKRFGLDNYVDSGCGMGREATLYLTSRGVRVTGTDAWSWDVPPKFYGRAVREDRRRFPRFGRDFGRGGHCVLPH